ncbi:NAD kinase [Bacillus sp. FJAT-49732]|uniref:NAD kinase n=1 Tax=Lederbergia citrisecunda TaxID=2833583 RepID=A0A942TQ29_9BACI|nr:NAD kinase [Lederbergia citrisecunda]MBS4199987.1 NAD kinase [Lederbergia citrisecunda]
MGQRNNIFFFHKNSPESIEKISVLKELAERYGFNIVKNSQEANLIASIGGDGMFLQAVRKTGFRQDCLYAGIQDDGMQGLYCDFHIDNLHAMIDAMTTEQIEVRRYPLIKVDVDKEGSFFCLNEFTIRSGIIKTLVMDVFIDGLHFETFRGDGMVIATPTGSTAYNKSVKGAVVDPLLPCLQVSEMASLNNNRYRTLGSPFILSEGRKLVLKVVQDGNDYPTMGMDNEALSSQQVEQVEIILSDKRIKTVKLKNNSFWEKVKRTFL